MPIKGMTDHAPMFPTIGTLRKGAKKTSENKPGADLTYLRFDSEDPLAVRMFAEAYPDQEALRNIHVFLPNRTADENMESWVEEWVAGGLVHRCDGETKVLWRTPAGGYSTEKVPCKNCKGKQVGRLSVIVPELGRLACITVLTTSIHDIIKLTAQLRAYEALRGDLRGIPFILRRRKEKVSTPGPDGKRLRREKWLLSIETQPEWTMLQLTAMQRAALPAGEPVEDVDEGHYEEFPQGISGPFEEEVEVDQETGEVVEESAEEGPTFTSLDEFLYRLYQEFQLTEQEARAKLKELGFTGWPKNGGARKKSTEMYLAVKKMVQQPVDELGFMDEPVEA